MHLTALLLLVGANLLWGSTWVVAKLALHELTPLQITAWRLVVAAVLVLPWLAREQARGALPWRAWPMLVVLGVVGFGLSKFLNFWGLRLTTATDASLLMSTEALFTIALGWLVLRERVSARRLAAFAVGAVGAYLLITRGLGLPGLSAAHVLGNLVFVAGLVGEAAYSVFGKSLLERHSAALVTAGTVVASTVVWGPAALADALLTGWPPLTLTTVPAVLFLALGATVLAFWAWFHALRHLEAGLAALTLFVQPVWGAALGVLVLDEPLAAATLWGGALVLVSLYLALWPARGQTPAPTFPADAPPAAPGREP